MRVNFRWNNNKEQMIRPQEARILELANKGSIIQSPAVMQKVVTSAPTKPKKKKPAAKKKTSKQTYQTRHIVAEGTA